MKTDRITVARDDKRHMIAEAAYFRFVNRNCADGDPVADWVSAEADIERSLADACRLTPQKKSLAHYQRSGAAESFERWVQRLAGWIIHLRSRP